MKIRTILALVLVLVACKTSAPPSHPLIVDADAAGLDTSSAAVCTHLASIKDVAGVPCRDGIDKDCVAELDKERADGLTILPVACWTLATTVEDARKCGAKVCAP